MPKPEGLNNRENLTSRHRLRGFDYRTPGYYFVTICTYKHQLLFGDIDNGTLLPWDAGTMLRGIIDGSRSQFPSATVDCYVVMPNHAHILLYLNLENPGVSPSAVVKWIKGASAAAFRDGVRNSGWAPFQSKVWKDGFHDEILRNDVHLDNVRRYIAENPERWGADEYFLP